jgi:hypothetical protein
VNRKENIKQFAIINQVRIESDTHHLNMPRVAIANLMVSRLIGASSHVPRLNVSHASQTLKYSLDTPEAPAAENCCLFFSHLR